MSLLGQLMQLGLFLFLIVPSIVVVTGLSLLETRGGQPNNRRGLLLSMMAAVIVLACLDLLIWANPAGRRLSSSLPGLGTLPALVALLALLARRARGIAQLWSTERLPLAGLGLAGLVLAGFLWVGEPTTFYAVLVLSAMLALAWLVGTRGSGAGLVALSLLCLGSLVVIGGGAFFTPGLDNPAWVITAWQIISGLGMVLAIFFSSAILFTCLIDETGLDLPGVSWRIVLAVLLVAGSAYMVYWDGVWSAALSRVFEDHLPFAQFLLAVMAGTLLALSVSGWRRVAGLVFVFVVCAVAIQALLWGWNVSAFALTERRAERVDTAVGRFYQANGRYPDRLSELTPGYLLYLPPPVVVRLGGWCYQGGQDYYRLGYVSGQFTYQKSTFETHLFKQAGVIPAGSWNCDQMVERFRRGGLVY
jgi:hypothetical protein